MAPSHPCVCVLGGGDMSIVKLLDTQFVKWPLCVCVCVYDSQMDERLYKR